MRSEYKNYTLLRIRDTLQMYRDLAIPNYYFSISTYVLGFKINYDSETGYYLIMNGLMFRDKTYHVIF